MRPVWRSIPSLPDYIACSDGHVMRVPFIGPMPLGGERHYGGLPHKGSKRDASRLSIMFNGKNYRVSRLVCEAFHGPSPFPRAVVMHLDDNAANNRAENLKWGTQKENLNTPSFIAYCKSRVGENSPTSKARRKALAE